MRGGDKANAQQARYYFGLDPDASLDDVEAVVDNYPVFRIASENQSQGRRPMSETTRPSSRRRGAKKASVGGGNAVYRLGLIGALVWCWHSRADDISTGGRPLRGLLVDAAETAATAMRRASIAIRPLETLEQMQDACTVLDRVWDIPPGQTSKIQPHLLRALGHGGNYVVGA